MNKNKLLIIFLLFLFLSSCWKSTPKEDIKKIVQEWEGKEIIIPEGIKFRTLGRDTLCSDVWNKPHKIFTYVDSIGCTSCNMGLHEWKAKILLCQQQQIDVEFIFAVYSSDFRRFEADILISMFDYPIIYDYHNDFEKLNHFPPVPYRTFLLDKDNKVQIIGSPINNPKMWELYKSVITLPQ